FVKTYGVTHFLTVAQLSANPFVYQGQVVAAYVKFDQMNSATEGLFFESAGLHSLVVSDIPSGKFTQSGAVSVLAGRVVGKKEIKLPLLGPTLVPQLSYVGSSLCQKPNCAEYAINK